VVLQADRLVVGSFGFIGVDPGGVEYFGRAGSEGRFEELDSDVVVRLKWIFKHLDVLYLVERSNRGLSQLVPHFDFVEMIQPFVDVVGWLLGRL
jgi:hypothetical protein